MVRGTDAAHEILITKAKKSDLSTRRALISKIKDKVATEKLIAVLEMRKSVFFVEIESELHERLCQDGSSREHIVYKQDLTLYVCQ
jgi:hypothetical protein